MDMVPFPSRLHSTSRISSFLLELRLFRMASHFLVTQCRAEVQEILLQSYRMIEPEILDI